MGQQDFLGLFQPDFIFTGEITLPGLPNFGLYINIDLGALNFGGGLDLSFDWPSFRFDIFGNIL